MTYPSYLNKSKKKFGLTGTVLKVLALLSMTIDHAALILIRNGMLYGYEPEYYSMAIATPLGKQLLTYYHIGRVIGRIAFPIYAFLVVEGFIHTKSFFRYFFRMLFMAILAEVPYDLAIFNETYNLSQQNVGWTFSIALLSLYFMDKLRKEPILSWIPVIAGAALAEFIRCDYGAIAIISMALLYVFRNEKMLRMVSGIISSAILSMGTYYAAIFAYIPIFFYNGERGRFHLRWFFYLYYPLHLLVMYIMIYIGAMITV